MHYWHSQTLADKVPHARLYKLTTNSLDADGLRWGANVKHYALGETLLPSPPMSLEEYAKQKTIRAPCQNKWIHAYTHPIIAVILNRVHTDIDQPKVWECEGDVKYETIDKKVYCNELMTKKTIPTPRISHHTRIKFAFGCVSKIYKDKFFENWMLDWISGQDKSVITAKKAADHCTWMMSRDDGAYAAHWSCWACIAFSDIRYINQCDRLVDYYAAMAALESNRVAHLIKEDFDLVSIAEITMSASK